MKKTKFIILGATVSAFVPFTALSAGCSKETQKEYIKSSDRITNIVTRDANNLELIKDSITVTYLIDVGQLKDKALFQSGWEGLLALRDQLEANPQLKGKVKFNPVVPSAVSDFNDFYNNTFAKSDIVVINGFTHGTTLASFLEKYDQKTKNTPLVICSEFEIPNSPYKKLINANSKFIESSYIVGNATAEYLALKYPNNPEKRIVASFGGGNFPGVLNFNEGFVRGIYDYNLIEGNKKTVHNTLVSTPFEATTGFATSESTFQPKIKAVMESEGVNEGRSGRPTVVLPVAGPATGVVLELINNLKTDQLVIGVDSDQGYAYTSNATRFASSITKEYGQTYYDLVFDYIFKGNNKYLEDDSVTHIYNIVGSYTDGWTKFSASRLANEEDRKLYDKALKDAQSRFEALTKEQKDFISSSKYYDKDGNQQNEEAQLKRVEKIILAIKENANK